jgi:hypothetical protein
MAEGRPLLKAQRVWSDPNGQGPLDPIGRWRTLVGNSSFIQNKEEGEQ